MVTCVPGNPLAGDTVEMVAVATVKGSELDQTPSCCTRAVPDDALRATVATTCVALQLTTVPRVLPSQTDPVPCTVPKPDPTMVTWTPAAPLVGETEIKLDGTAKGFPALGRPFTVTATFPVLTAAGAVMVMLSFAQLSAVPALTPLNVTVLVP